MQPAMPHHGTKQTDKQGRPCTSCRWLEITADGLVRANQATLIEVQQLPSGVAQRIERLANIHTCSMRASSVAFGLACVAVELSDLPRALRYRMLCGATFAIDAAPVVLSAMMAASCVPPPMYNLLDSILPTLFVIVKQVRGLCYCVNVHCRQPAPATVQPVGCRKGIGIVIASVAATGLQG